VKLAASGAIFRAVYGYHNAYLTTRLSEPVNAILSARFFWLPALDVC